MTKKEEIFNFFFFYGVNLRLSNQKRVHHDDLEEVNSKLYVPGEISAIVYVLKSELSHKSTTKLLSK